MGYASATVHLDAVFGYSAARERGINSRLLIAWLVLALAISCARFLRFALDEPDWLAAQVSIKGVAHSTHAHSADANVATASRLQSVMRVMRGTLLA